MSQYIRQLIRADQIEKARQALEVEVLKGLRSGESTPMTSEAWEEIRQEIKKRRAKEMR